MANKVIDPAPIIEKLADRCLKAKGLECSVLGSVIDLLKAAPGLHAPYWSTEAAYKNGYEAGKPKWIPVSERLPENELDRVLVATDCNLPFGNQKIDTDRYRNGKWVRYGDNVTHWMPLPEPPEGE